MASPTARNAVGAEQDEKRRWLALIVLCAGMLMIILDATVVNVALPSIQSDLGFSQSSLAWVINAYLIPFGGLLLLAGRLGDLIGRRSIFLSGLALFTTASVLCGLATEEWMLIAARFVQGIGGALTSAVILGMVVTMFPKPAEQAKAIGVYTFTAAGGGSVGLVLGGVLTTAINWHWIFFVNVPVGIVAFIATRRLVEHEEGAGLHNGADVLGALLVTSSLMLGVYAIVTAADHGWGSAHTLGLGAIAVGLLAGFIARQATAKQPLMPLSIFRSRALTGANVVQMLTVAGLFGFQFLGALYLQRVLGYDAIQTGLAILPVAVLIASFSVVLTPRLIMRFGGRAVLVPGLVALSAGLLLLGRAPVDGGYWVDVLPAMLTLGLGAGLALPALMTLAMAEADPAQAGLASGLVNTTQQVGGALGLAVLATLSTTRSDSMIRDGATHAHALTSGYHLAFVIGAILVASAIVVGLSILRQTRSAPESFEAVPERA